MKKLILTAVLIVLGLNVGCRLGCTPYDNCGPVYANPYNCTPNYRSGSVLNGAATNPGAVEYAPANAVPAAAPATVPATAPTNDSFTPSAHPAPSATPAPIPTTTYNRPVYRTNQQSFQSAYRAHYQQR
ncbi:MAG: hypothetical protein IJF84_00985 [Thermoguttaceae bacterium]|nr:hypothetical protein [Thermoguttaceae bacterium]